MAQTKGTPKRAAKLEQDLRRLQEGDAKHPEKPLPTSVRSEIDAAVTSLDGAIVDKMAKQAASHEASQTLRTTQKTGRAALTAGRRAVYSLHTDQNRVVEDYGCTVRKKAQRRGGKPKTGGKKETADKKDTTQDKAGQTESKADGQTSNA